MLFDFNKSLDENIKDLIKHSSTVPFEQGEVRYKLLLSPGPKQQVEIELTEDNETFYHTPLKIVREYDKLDVELLARREPWSDKPIFKNDGVEINGLNEYLNTPFENSGLILLDAEGLPVAPIVAHGVGTLVPEKNNAVLTGSVEVYYTMSLEAAIPEHVVLYEVEV